MSNSFLKYKNRKLIHRLNQTQVKRESRNIGKNIYIVIYENNLFPLSIKIGNNGYQKN